jgi:hypothetical protein
MFDLVFTGDASKAIFNGGITFVIVLLILAGFCSAHFHNGQDITNRTVVGCFIFAAVAGIIVGLFQCFETM